jgi:hypothetical protein
VIGVDNYDLVQVGQTFFWQIKEFLGPNPQYRQESASSTADAVNY